MGSGGSGAVDYGIGAIVWVRRRNGSWWPGKVVGPDELGECDLTSPRTGTPVKLLGREDASVDWYNLEKSKRVKAFRCGEFDDCIERAEAAQGMPMKKREKYARREDAILHALELEKESLGKQGKLGAIADHPRSRSSGSAMREPVTASEAVASEHLGKPGNDKLNQFLNRVDTKIKDECIGNSLRPKDEYKPMSENSHSEATPRMRGLHDFGLRPVSLKRKTLSPVHSDGSEKIMIDNHLQAHPIGASSMKRTNHANEVEQMGAVSRAKRSKCFYFPTEVNDSLDDKEPAPDLIKMFEDDDGHPRHNFFNEQNSSSTFMEDIESDDSSETNTSDSDSSETEADEDNEITVYPDAGIQSESERDVVRETEAQEHESTSSKEPGEIAYSGERHRLYPGDPFLTNDAGSKWQLKGKRNIRHLMKNSVDKTTDVKDLDGPLHGIHNGIKGSALRQRAYGTDYNRDYSDSQMVGMGNGRYLYNPKVMSKGRNTGRNVIDWRDWTRVDRPAFKGCCEDRAEHFNPITFGCHYFAGRKRPMLVDVDLKVQGRYPKEPVPIVSLVSRLNGKAIIGRPIQIEALEDGSSETLVYVNDHLSMEAVDLDGSASDTPAWRTARRTNFRVPRPDLPSAVGGEDLAKDSAFIDQEGRLSFKKLSMGSFSHNAIPITKSLPQISRPLVGKKFPRKMTKKASLSINQKTRTLSSIVVQHYSGSSLMDGLIKSDTSRPTAVACIPVKLVFSRLLEKINRPPSKAASKLVSNRDTGRQPS